MIIETERLILREMVDEDYAHLHAIFSDAETMRYFPAPFDETKIRRWVVWNRESYETRGYGLWMVVLKATGEVVGDCGLIHQVVDGEEEVEVGYHFNRKYWGSGYATEAALACREWAFRELDVDYVISLIRPENQPSCRVAERNGMTIWKEMEKAGYRHFVYVYRK